MKPRYTITITDHLEEKIETVDASSAIVLTTEKSTEEELKNAFEEMRMASPQIEVRLDTDSHLDLLFLENAFAARMKHIRKEEPELGDDIQTGIMRYIQSLQQASSTPDAGGDRSEASSLIARLLDKEET